MGTNNGATGFPILQMGSRAGRMSEDEYRHYAIECLLLARELRDSVHEAVLLAMAGAWSALADQAAATIPHVAGGEEEQPRGACLKRHAPSLPPRTAMQIRVAGL
jgi:hypothetical protein